MIASPHLRFLLAVLLGVLAWGRPLRNLGQLAFSDDNYSYIVLVFGITALFLAVEMRGPWPSRAASGYLKSLTAAFLILAAWFNYRTDFAVAGTSLTVSILAFVLFVFSAFAMAYGWDTCWRFRYPLLLLVLAVPMPKPVMTWLVVALQRASADAAALLFRLFRVPVVREGLVFAFSKIEIEVAEECSGIRSSTILVFTALVLAQMFLRSAWSRALVVLAALPIAVAKNGFRIFVLSLLGEYVSTSWLEGPLHHQGGVVFFSVGLATVILLIVWLRRFDKPRAPNQRRWE